MELRGHPERIEAFRRGDRALLGELYREHMEAVERFLRGGFTFTSQGRTIRFAGYHEPFELQEAIQEGFLHAFRQSARERYDGERPYRPLLLTIIKNKTIDRWRREQHASRLFVMVGEVAGADESHDHALERLQPEQPAQSPERQAASHQLQRTLQGFMEGLEEPERTIVDLHLLGEMSQRDIADHLGISRNDIRKHVRLLRQRLLRQLKRDGHIASLEVSDVLRAVSLILGVAS